MAVPFGMIAWAERERLLRASSDHRSAAVWRAGAARSPYWPCARQEETGTMGAGTSLIRTPADGVGRGFSGIGNADRLKRHESGGRTMAHVADHLSFETLADLERAIADRCRVLDGDPLSLGTNFHWWPKPAKPA